MQGIIPYKTFDQISSSLWHAHAVSKVGNNDWYNFTGDRSVSCAEYRQQSFGLKVSEESDGRRVFKIDYFEKSNEK